MTSEVYRHVSHCCRLPLNLFRNGSCGLSKPQKTYARFVFSAAFNCCSFLDLGGSANNIWRPSMLAQIVTGSQIMGCTEDDQKWHVFDEELQVQTCLCWFNAFFQVDSTYFLECVFVFGWTTMQAYYTTTPAQNKAMKAMMKQLIYEGVVSETEWPRLRDKWLKDPNVFVLQILAWGSVQLTYLEFQIHLHFCCRRVDATHLSSATVPRLRT